MRLIRVAASAIGLLSCSAAAQGPWQGGVEQGGAKSVLLFVGSYTQDLGWVNGTGKGIYAFKFDTESGALTKLTAKAFGDNPTFVTGFGTNSGGVIYATNEVSVDSVNNPGTKTGYVHAIQYDSDGTLTEINRKESNGYTTAHVSVSPNRDFVAVSNYGSGSVALFPISSDGSLLNISDFHQYTGGSNVTKQQSGPHMHSMTWVGGKSTGVFGVDLGNDRIVQYHLDTSTKKVVPNADKEFILRPRGSGPRHMVIHPSKKFAYVVEEISNTIGVYSLDAASGTLSVNATQTISTLPANTTVKSAAAEIHVTDDGKFLYSSNRGHDSIAMFTVGSDGQLTLIGFESTRGKIPRAFLIYKNFLIVANQDTNDLFVFTIDKNTGKLIYANQTAKIGTPVTLFIPRD